MRAPISRRRAPSANAAAANVTCAQRAAPSLEIDRSAGHSYFDALVSGNNIYRR